MRSKRMLLVVPFTVGMLIAGAANVTARQTHPAPFRGTTHVVKGGDTLWSIVRDAYPKRDPREQIGLVRKANKLKSSAIVPGQRLLLPAP